MTSPVLTTRQDGDGIVWLSIDVPDRPVNLLNQAVLAALETICERLVSDRSVKGLILSSGKPDGFVAGADIDEIARLDSDGAYRLARRAQVVLQKLADLPMPTVAAIHGPCLGGGLELALACTERVVSREPATRLGLPEVRLGLIPGAGGTQRLPRLIGITAALDLILTGKTIDPVQTVKLGLAAEAVAHDHLLTAALAQLKALQAGAAEKGGQRTVRERLQDSILGRQAVVSAAQKRLLAKATHYPAPLKALTAVAEGLEKSLEEGLILEAKLFSELVGTKISRALIHVFQATTAAKGRAARQGGRPVAGLGVIGGGLMGSGIAIVAAEAGLPVRVKDVDERAISRTLRAAQAHFTDKVERGRLPDFEKAQVLGRISGTVDGSGMASCDVVIEAAFEDLGLKQKLLADWEARAKGDGIFASNTSSLPIGLIAKGARHPERVIGMHFFSPVPKMPLVEVIVHPGTADWVTATTIGLARRLGKHVIVVNDGVGFYTTRVVGAYLNETLHLIADGATIEAIDTAMVDVGFPVGPCALMDEVGLDVGMKVVQILHDAFGERLAPPSGARELTRGGTRLGRKSGSGFYDYQQADRPVDKRIYESFPDRPATPLSQPEIQRRLLLAFCNEAAWALADGVLREPADGDLGAVYGLGFPPFLGGPFWYLDQLGLPRVRAELAALADRHGARFTAAPVLHERDAFY